MIENEIGEVRDQLYDDLLYTNPENSEYDICMAKLDLCDRFLEYIANLDRKEITIEDWIKYERRMLC